MRWRLVLTLAFVEGLAGGPHPHQDQEEEERPEQLHHQPHLRRMEPHHFLFVMLTADSQERLGYRIEGAASADDLPGPSYHTCLIAPPQQILSRSLSSLCLERCGL